MTVAQAVVLFFLYSFLGWSIESVFCSIREKRFVNRGFLFGPLCPIYGFGSLILVVSLHMVVSNPILVFCLSYLLTTALEYVVSFLLEAVFHKSWWDYSDFPLNINGRVWLVFSIAWAVLSMILLYIVHPLLMLILSNFSETILWIAAIVAVVLILVDIVFSVRDTVIFNRQMKQLAEISAKIDRLKEDILRFGSTKRDSLLAFGSEQKDRLEKELANLLSQRENIASAFLARMQRILNAFPKIKLNRKDSMSLRERLLNFRREK